MRTSSLLNACATTSVTSMPALEKRPAAPGPLVLLYPFREYHRFTEAGERLDEA